MARAGRPRDLERRTIALDYIKGQGRGKTPYQWVKELKKLYPEHVWHRTTLLRWRGEVIPTPALRP